jgi:dihydrodipicolinate synthase/N-acetylneuraminate lyase
MAQIVSRTAAIVAMRRKPVTPEDLRGVFAVPPLARRRDAQRTIDVAQNDRLVRHIVNGGITRLLYGGNAFLYHITIGEYEMLVDWLAALPDRAWAIPSIGPSFGRALDQAPLVRSKGFPTAMLLPCNDPRDASGLEAGIRELIESAGVPLILYLKEEDGFGRDRVAGLDAIARLVDDGLVIAIKYAVVRQDPLVDPYLDQLLARVDRARVVSGMGERPAVQHLRQFGLPGFTTGSGCVAPGPSQAIFEACAAGEWSAAESLRAAFLPLEDVRDAWGPARVLHAAVEAAGIADTGAIPPFVSELNAEQLAAVRGTAVRLASVSVQKIAQPTEH